MGDLESLEKALAGVLLNSGMSALWSMPSSVIRVRVKPFEPDRLMSSPWCKYYEGQIGTVTAEGWSMCRVRFDDGKEHMVTYYSLEVVEDE